MNNDLNFQRKSCRDRNSNKSTNRKPGVSQMNIRKISILIIVYSTLVVNIFAQVKEVTEQEFTEKQFSSFEKDAENAYRKKITTETFGKGKLIHTQIIVEESINPDKSRELRTNISDGEKDVIETIQIGDGDVFYCRQNAKPWRKLTYPCHAFFDKDYINEEGGSKFTVERVNLNGKEVKLYREYAIFKWGETANSYFDSKFWITDDGFIIKRIKEIGDSKSKIVFHRTTELIEYNPEGLKIEAPEIEKNDLGEKEFQQILDKSETLKKGKSYRRVSFNMVLEENSLKLLREYTIIDEVLPPNRSYYYYKDEEANLITTIEEITVGEKYFERKDGEEWKTTRTIKLGMPIGVSDIKVEVKKIKFLGTEVYKNKTFKVYEVFEKFSSKVFGDTEKTERYRFDTKGLLWSITRSKKNLRDSNILITTDNYDFDAKISIETPVIGRKP